MSDKTTKTKTKATTKKEAGPRNKNLSKAKKDPHDEFYTQLHDIENEVDHYKDHFKGKTVYCNCDDCFASNFFVHFALDFNRLGLKKLVVTCYENSLQSTKLLFNETGPDGNTVQNDALLKYVTKLAAEKGKVLDKDKIAYKIEINEVKDINNDDCIDIIDIAYSLIQNDKNKLTILDGNGSYDSPECLEILKECDIVVTNPPFSLFREYVAKLMEYNKKFLIIGNQTAITYKEIFPLLRDNKIWIGYGMNLSMVYKTPYKNTNTDNQKFVKSKGYNPDDGYINVKGITWFTNLTHNKRIDKLTLYKKYNENDYPKYNNYDVISVDKVAEIPEDYFGVIGVPITFLDKYNPNQFELIGMAEDNGKGFSGTEARWDGINPHCVVNGVNKFKRIFIKRKDVKTNG